MSFTKVVLLVDKTYHPYDSELLEQGVKSRESSALFQPGTVIKIYETFDTQGDPNLTIQALNNYYNSGIKHFIGYLDYYTVNWLKTEWFTSHSDAVLITPLPIEDQNPSPNFLTIDLHTDAYLNTILEFGQKFSKTIILTESGEEEIKYSNNKIVTLKGESVIKNESKKNDLKFNHNITSITSLEKILKKIDSINSNTKLNPYEKSNQTDQILENYLKELFAQSPTNCLFVFSLTLQKDIELIINAINNTIGINLKKFSFLMKNYNSVVQILDTSKFDFYISSISGEYRWAYLGYDLFIAMNYYVASGRDFDLKNAFGKTGKLENEPHYSNIRKEGTIIIEQKINQMNQYRQNIFLYPLFRTVFSSYYNFYDNQNDYNEIYYATSGIDLTSYIQKDQVLKSVSDIDTTNQLVTDLIKYVT